MPSETDIRSIQWAMWGNETALLSAYVLAMGGIIGIIGGTTCEFLFWFPIGIYGLIFGLLILCLEYPRGKKVKGHTMIRWLQTYPSKAVDKLPFVSNYYHRAFGYFVVCLPALMIVPTFLGAVGVFIACGIYVKAGTRGEVWSPVVFRPQLKPGGSVIAGPPQRPPPRLPSNTAA